LTPGEYRRRWSLPPSYRLSRQTTRRAGRRRQGIWSWEPTDHRVQGRSYAETLYEGPEQRQPYALENQRHEINAISGAAEVAMSAMAF
jgi:hypothetical protein